MSTKILMVSEPGSAGVKRHVLDLLFNLDRTVFVPHYVYSMDRADESYQKEIKRLENEKKIDCTQVPMVRGVNPASDYKSIKLINNIVKNFNPDIIHAHSSKAGFLIRIMRMLGLIKNEIKVIFTPNVLSVFNSKLFFPIEKLLGYYTDILVASSQSEKKQLKNMNLVDQKSLIYIYLACRKEEEYPTLRPRTKASFTISACGRICKQKRALLFFQVAEKVANKRHDVHFQWIGDYGSSPDKEAKKVQNFIKNHNLENTEITGWVTDPDREIAKSDLFCMFSRYESFGYVTVDSMMMEVPVLALPAMGTEDHIIEGRTGWFCQEDPVLIADKIIELMKKPKVRLKVANEAKKFVKNRYNLPKIITEHENLYHELAKQ